MKFPSAKDALKDAIESVMKGFESLGFETEDLNRLRLGVAEALINAMEHGNKFKSNLFIDVDVDIKPDRIVVRIKDQGKGFDPGELPTQFERENLWSERGRGILLIKAFFDEVRFNEDGNEITMVKHLHDQKSKECPEEE